MSTRHFEYIIMSVGAIVVYPTVKNDFPKGFYLVFVAKADDYDCREKHSLLPRRHGNSYFSSGNRTSKVDFKVVGGIKGKDYSVASTITLGVIVGFCVVAIAMVAVFTKFGTISRLARNAPNDDAQPLVPQQHRAINQEAIAQLLRERLPTVDNLTWTPTHNRRSCSYFWHILSVAIFYSIPVIQLVINYQRMSNGTGNQDMCYYNFLCANPGWGLNDFNHVFSNVGYVFMGLLFLGVVCHRKSLIPDNALGIPLHYGMFYAMGVALIIEGILSACYHVCPNQSNYQFDTSFMYVMVVLCLIKLYQNRHSDVSAAAYITFLVLGFAILLAMVGIISDSVIVWILFGLIYASLCTYMSLEIYFFGFVSDGLRLFKTDLRENGVGVEVFRPARKWCFVILIIANVINYVMLITLGIYNSEAIDFGTFVLLLSMGNAGIYAFIYISMKLYVGERICVEAIFYGLFAVAAWTGAAVFFFDNVTLWTVTPAESRQWNQDCILMNFYDVHDIWHFLSAPALYFTFMFLLCLDDDIIEKDRPRIVVF